MGDDPKNAADGQTSSADAAAATPAPAHDAAIGAAAPSPPAGNKAETTTDQPAESSPQGDASSPKAEVADKKSSADDTVATAAADDDQDEPKAVSGGGGSKPVAIVASNKKARPPYKYDPNKITLRFLFANKDGLTVTVECNPGDTVGEVKGALMSVWPDGKSKNGNWSATVPRLNGYSYLELSYLTFQLA
jgi:hypothetical protein